MRSVMLALVAVTVLGVGTAFAGGATKGDVELGVYGGYGLLDDYGGLNPKNGPYYGARAGYFFSRHVSAELLGQRLSTKTNVVGVPEADFHVSSGRANLFYNFMVTSPLRPYLTVGGGYEKTDVQGTSSNGQFGWNGGAGLRLLLNRTWSLRGDGRYVGARVDQLNNTQNNYEFGLGLSALFGGKEDEEQPTPAPENPAPANQEPSVSCVTDRTEVVPGEAVHVTATASDPDGDPLTYSWTTTSGMVSGEGSTATLQFEGATPPATATVTVKVADNHGHEATSNCAVNLVQPAKQQAEAVSCLAGGFPRNLSRLTNVDKACLDDMAQRLKSDPNSHVIVIGHAESQERSPEKVGQQRADAVRDYLVQSGVDASRIKTRSSGDSHPVDASTSTVPNSRRVEVWFVPEGATEP